MAKKTYFTPVLLTGSGDVDITDSEQGETGTGTTGLWNQLTEWGIKDLAVDILGEDPNTWASSYPGFDPNDSSTWFDFYLAFYMDHVAG